MVVVPFVWMLAVAAWEGRPPSLTRRLSGGRVRSAGPSFAVQPAEGISALQATNRVSEVQQKVVQKTLTA